MPSPIPIISGEVLTASLVELYRVPTNDPKLKQVRLTGLRFVNTDSVSRTITLHIIPPGKTATVATSKFVTTSIPASSGGDPPPFFNMDDIMLPGTAIQASASAAGVVAISAHGESYP